MQNQLKQLNEEILPEAFQLLEEGNSIAEVRLALGGRVEDKLKNIFLNRINFYIKKKYRQKYDLLKNILVLSFSLFFVAMLYIRFLDYFSNPEIFSTFYIILNLLLAFFFVNVIWKMAQWEGSYLRSIIVLMFVFSLGDFLSVSANLTNLAFMIRFVLQVVSGAIALFLYRNIFPTHGFFGAPKEEIKERNILDDFR